jgi:hypothetical protein
MNRLQAFDRLSYSGKHRHHGLNNQGLNDDIGTLVRISDGLPGSVHDLTAAHTVVTSVSPSSGVSGGAVGD